MPNEFENDVRLADRLDQLEDSLRDFGKMTKRDLLTKLASLNLKDRTKLFSRITFRSRGGLQTQKVQPLQKSLTSKVRQQDGSIVGLSWGFVQHGIFLEHGVGKGRKIGSSKARAAAKPWIEPVLSVAIDELANMLEKEYADIVTAEVSINIPGVITTKSPTT